MSDNKNLARKVQASLKDLGHEIPLGHCYELLAKLSGFASYNVAKAKNANLVDPIVSQLKINDFDRSFGFDPVVRRYKEKLKKVYFYLWAEHFQDMKIEDLVEEIKISGMKDKSDHDILDFIHTLYEDNLQGLDVLLKRFDLDDVARKEILSTLFDNKAAVEPNAHSVFNLKTEEQDFLSFISQAEKQQP